MGALILLSALLTCITCVKCQATCAEGQCKSIYQCPPLLALLNKPARTQQEIQILRKAQCGMQEDIPQVCCPSECFTPEWNLGYCISIYSCPALSNMLKPPVSDENMAFVQNSRCEGPDQYSVCCSNEVNSEPVKPTKGCALTAAPPYPRTQCCGVEINVGNKIFGGTATGVDQYPWLALIEYRQGSNIKLLCGGALISGRYVVTAGHCVRGPVLRYGRPINVRLGEYNTTQEGQDCIPADGGGVDCTQGTIIIPIEKIIPHPGYDPDQSLRRDDIALLRLTQIVHYTDFIRPICLPTSDLTLNPPQNFTLFVAGWGAVNETTSSSTVKLHVGLPYLSLQSCQPAYSISKRNVTLWSGQICAGGVEGQDSCKGDSGGPLMYLNKGTWEMTGIVSFGPTPCGIEYIPGVYTKTFQYIPWLRSQMKP